MTAHHSLPFYRNIKLKNWMIATAGALAIKECVVVSTQLNQIIYPAGLLASILFVGIAGYMLGQVYQRLSPANRMLAVLCSALVVVVLFGDSGAVHAQFLLNAEAFFDEGVGRFGLDDSLGDLIFLIFWLIRGAFVIGVAIALLPAIQAAREGEEWRSLAKTPMIVVGIVLAGATAVDFLTGGVGG